MLVSSKINYLETIPIDNVKKSGVYLAGLGYDGMASFRRGARDGPSALREAARGLESYSPYQGRALEDFSFFDLGDFSFGQSGHLEEDWREGISSFEKSIFPEMLREGVKMVSLGGDHSISYAPIKSYLQAFKDLVLLHLDAHADLRERYQGQAYSHASIIQRSLDHFGPKHRLIQYGIRSGTREEYAWMEKNQTLQKSRKDLLKVVHKIPKQRPCYLTLDLDYFDPAFLPGTGTPEPGGEDFSSFVQLIKLLNKKNFVGADVVELSPPLDPTGNSSIFAAKVVREILLALQP